MVPTNVPVVIIGAGPTGLGMAAQLMRYNIGCIILEKNTKTTHLSKAVVVQARTLEIFQQLGIAEEAIQKGRITTALNIFYKGAKKATLDLAGMGNGLSPFPFVLSLEQSKTETLLADHLAKHDKTIAWGSEFLRLEQKENIHVYYKDAAGNEQEIVTKYLVGCDGAGSPVRHQLGGSFGGDTLPKIFYVADVDLSSDTINRDELFIFLIKKGFILFFPMEGKDHYRIIGILPDKTGDDQFDFDDIKDSIIAQVKVPLVFNQLRWFSSYKVHTRRALSFKKGNCFIAGDAAHIHTPAGGQGMNTGIQDAYNLAWKIAYSIHYNAAPLLLETYDTERTGNAAHLLKTTDRMFDFMIGAGSFRNFFRLRIFPAIANFISGKPSINKVFFPLLSQTGIAYPDSRLTIPSKAGKVKAGDRMPYFTFADGTNIYDHLNAPAFSLLCFGTAAKENNMAQLPFPVNTISFTEYPTRLFGNRDGFYILLRPDNHIVYIGTEISPCVELLKKFFPV